MCSGSIFYGLHILKLWVLNPVSSRHVTSTKPNGEHALVKTISSHGQRSINGQLLLVIASLTRIDRVDRHCMRWTERIAVGREAGNRLESRTRDSGRGVIRLYWPGAGDGGTVSE